MSIGPASGVGAIFLDTHAVAWLYQAEQRRFPAAVWRLMSREDLLASPAVFLELQLLHEIGRIKPVAHVILEDLRHRVGLRLSEQAFGAIATEATQLAWTRDPFDRLIVADASIAGARLVTKDATIRAHYRRAVWD